MWQDQLHFFSTSSFYSLVIILSAPIAQKLDTHTVVCVAFTFTSINVAWCMTSRFSSAHVGHFRIIDGSQ